MAQGLLAYKYCFTGWIDKGALTVDDVWHKYAHELNYICGQTEQTISGKKHSQFWVEFKTRKRPAGVKKIFSPDMYHHERIRGSDEENNKYCTKQESRIDGPWQWGETKHSRQAAIKEAVEVTDKVSDGASERSLWEQHPVYMVRCHNGVRRMIEVIQAEIVRPKFTLAEFSWQAITNWGTTHVFQGDSGIGKTSFAIAHFENPFFCRELDNLRNFNAAAHDGIVFDDLADKLLELNDDVLVHLLDVDHPSQIKCRYNNATIPSNTRKIFTTTKDAGAVFGRTPQVLRRVTIHKLEGKQSNRAAIDNDPIDEDEKLMDNGLTAPLPDTSPRHLSEEAEYFLSQADTEEIEWDDETPPSQPF